MEPQVTNQRFHPKKFKIMVNSNDPENIFSREHSCYEIGNVVYRVGDYKRSGLLSAKCIFGRIILVLSRDGKQNDVVFTGSYSYDGGEYNAKVVGDPRDCYFNIPDILLEMVERKRGDGGH